MAQFRRGGRRRRKVCYFTTNKITKIDYKDVDLLKRFVSDRGKILPRRVTGTSAKYQRELTVAIKRARQMALYHSLLNSNNTLFTNWRGIAPFFITY